MKSKIFYYTTGLLMLAVASSASALSIDPTGDTMGGNPGTLASYQVSATTLDVGSSFELNWAWNSGGDQVSAAATFTINAMTATTFDLGVSLTNTSVVSGDSNPRILALGINFDPDVVVSGVTDSSGSDTDKLSSFSQGETFAGLQKVDVCVFSWNCSGGKVSTGLASGETDEFIISMTGSFADGIIMSDFGLKFQAINSYELPGQPGCDNGCTKVPAPGTAFLLGLGLLGLAGIRKAKI